MNNSKDDVRAAIEQIKTRINLLHSQKQHPIVVSIDGGSGAGKSTFAVTLAREVNAALIPTDDFFAANMPDHKWDEFTVEEKLKYVLDWQRVQTEVLAPLLKRQPAKWYTFDFQAGLRADGTYGMEAEPKERQPADVLLLEGAYSASPQLANLVDLTILIDVPVEERHARIAKREALDFLAIWHRRWDEVEEYYFKDILPKSSFDIVVELG